MEQGSNIAETLAAEMKAPIELGCVEHVSRVALPPGWKWEEKDNEKHLASPLRKKGTITLADRDSYIEYLKRHTVPGRSTIWCEADYVKGIIAFKAILNDLGGGANDSSWRDHIANFTPAFSVEWNRWFGKNKETTPQASFAEFIEENLKDIAGGDELPSGAQMLEMALQFEATQDSRFKSAIRLQNCGVQLSYTQDDDDQTITRMQMFDRFAIGIPVFWNGAAYRIESRLRYRHRDGRVNFWFELIRPDKVVEDAAKTLIMEIKDATGLPFFFGKPF